LKGDLTSIQWDAYALTRLGPLFTGIEGGVSWDGFDKLKRETGFPAVNAGGNTQGKEYSVASTVGANFNFRGITLTPAARVGYAGLDIDRFVESAPILALQYSNQDVTTGFWTARVRATTSGLFGNPLAFTYGEVGYEKLFSTSQNYTAKLYNNTAHAVTLSDNLDARGLFLRAGVGGYVGSIKLSGEYQASLQDNDGTIQSGRLRVTIPLSGDAPLKY
jgi:outer membrane lipase/esterase